MLQTKLLFYLDLGFSEQSGPDLEHNTLVLLQWADCTLNDCAAIGPATVQLCLELGQRPARPRDSAPLSSPVFPLKTGLHVVRQAEVGVNSVLELPLDLLQPVTRLRA